jgi:N-acetylglucosaminyldiphosphoundecaprenol N-acetyl-beta-D-mannosaminyltransferase
MRNIVLGSLALRIGTARQLHEGLRAARGARRGLSVGFVNPHVYNLAGSQAPVRAFLESCDFACLDGIGTAFAARAQNRAWLPRLVMDQVFDDAVAAGAVEGEVLLLGLGDAEIEAAAAALRVASPRMRVAGCYGGFLSDAEYADIFSRHPGVDFVLAGMGTPRSEEVLLQARRLLPGAVAWHVGGGTLRNWAGSKRRAPRWVSRAGLEWAHRMWHEPGTRERYTRGFPAFAGRLAGDLLRSRSLSPSQSGTEMESAARPVAAPVKRSMI